MLYTNARDFIQTVFGLVDRKSPMCAQQSLKTPKGGVRLITERRRMSDIDIASQLRVSQHCRNGISSLTAAGKWGTSVSVHPALPPSHTIRLIIDRNYRHTKTTCQEKHALGSELGIRRAPFLIPNPQATLSNQTSASSFSLPPDLLRSTPGHEPHTLFQAIPSFVNVASKNPNGVLVETLWSG
jgi:hypothetical protein